jgi:hypothetical protein
MEIRKTILDLLKNRKSLFLIGPSNSGKTWFIKNDIIPYLAEHRLKPAYFANADQISNTDYCTAAVIDEIESLQDRVFLETAHPIEKPYYSTEYLNKLNRWFTKLRTIKAPSVYIITRNHQIEIKNFVATVKTTDWDNRPVEIIEFNKFH